MSRPPLMFVFLVAVVAIAAYGMLTASLLSERPIEAQMVTVPAPAPAPAPAPSAPAPAD